MELVGSGRQNSVQHLRLALASWQERDPLPDADEPGRQGKCPVVYCNQVGGNDELVFDGGSLAFNARRKPDRRGAELFAEDFVVVDTEATAPVAPTAFSDEENLFIGRLCWGCGITCTSADSSPPCWASAAESIRH